MTVKIAAPPTARAIEVFSGIQGEGLNVGTRQIFIRFAGCDLRCDYCDSAHTWTAPDTCRIEKTPGDRDFEVHPNPVPLPLFLDWIDRQNQPGLHDSISLTGGEPLLHAAFLAEFLPQLKQRTGLPLYLESGGHRPQQLQRILPYLDLVGMDIKLPSVSGETHWQAHQEFLSLCCAAGVDVFVKIIVSDDTLETDLEQAAQLVAQVNPQVTVFLQPVTPLNAGETANFGDRPPHAIKSPAPTKVLAWQGVMKRWLKPVRVVPQTHKMLGQL